PHTPSSTLFPYTTLFRSSLLAIRLFFLAAPQLLSCRGLLLPFLTQALGQLVHAPSDAFEDALICFRRATVWILHHPVFNFFVTRSEEHTSEIQSRAHLEC